MFASMRLDTLGFRTRAPPSAGGRGVWGESADARGVSLLPADEGAPVAILSALLPSRGPQSRMAASGAPGALRLCRRPLRGRLGHLARHVLASAVTVAALMLARTKSKGRRRAPGRCCRGGRDYAARLVVEAALESVAAWLASVSMQMTSPAAPR